MRLRVEQREPVQGGRDGPGHGWPGHGWPGRDRPERGWLLYDAGCVLCRRWAERVRGPLMRQGFEVTPLQEPWVREYFHEMSERELLAAVRVLRRDGRHYAGGDAVMHVGRYVWWLLPIWLAGHVPPLRPVIRAGYEWVARHRGSFG